MSKGQLFNTLWLRTDLRMKSWKFKFLLKHSFNMCFIMIIGSFSCQLQIQKWIASLILEEAAWHWRSPPFPTASLMFCLASLHIPEQRTESHRSQNKTQDLFYKYFKGIRRWRIDDKGFLCHGGHFTSSACLVHWPDSSLLLAAVQGENHILLFFFPLLCLYRKHAGA